MVDVAWSVEAPVTKWGCGARGLVLAAEIEWGSTEDYFWEDFVKLSDVMADRRLYVGELQEPEFSSVQDGGAGLSAAISCMLEHHRHFGALDAILVAVWGGEGDDEQFVARLYYGDGRSELLLADEAS